MASTIVSLPPHLEPLPPTPPRPSPKKLSPYPEHKDENGVYESPSPYTRSSFGTSTSMDSAMGGPRPTMQKRRVLSDSMIAPHVNSPRLPVERGTVRLEDFELIRVLGKGCAGRVLLVRQTATSSILAMKAISKRSVLTHDELTHTIAELIILKRFAVEDPENPFIARLHHSFTDRENFYFVMDFYPGGDMATQMEIYGILGHHRTRFYAADIVQGLEDLHRQGIIVRDLKPENILLNARGHAVLADFGLSKEFPYRGDPKPLHVVTYPGQGELPEWAGKGAASVRTTLEGRTKLMIDRAYSFVGTAEYLSPEVVKRGEYSYAVDWWALGCIVLEGMIGRVPFRKEEEEPPIVLWNKILYDPWDDIFKDPKLVKRPPSYYGLDPTTWHFIDSLLIKDPMWRLTEPYVKKHGYFQYIDWDTVRRGEYEDPHDLQLHPVSEYNTHYFPKLCLEEEPSVDMSSHDIRYNDDTEVKTPLNDNVLYMLEQAKHKAELESFTWSREYFDEVDEIESEVQAETEADEQEEPPMLVEEEGIEEQLGTEIELPPLLPPAKEEYGDILATETGVEDEVELPADGGDAVPELEEHSPLHGKDLSSGLTLLSTPPGSPLSALVHATQIPLPSPGNTDDEMSPPIPPKKDTVPIPMVRPTHHIEHQLSAPRPIPTSPKRLKPVRTKSHDHDLPTGLPASGLSVSDMVSIHSPGLGSPSRIVRRHRALPSADTPGSRLSVELNGAITLLGDDDWEQLDMTEAMESMPNGNVNVGPSSFFNRVLKRRPSTLHASGLRRQTKASDTSSRRSTSPDKQKLPTTPGLFGSKSLNTTKKALEKIKAFPKLRKASAVHAPPDTLLASASLVPAHQPPSVAFSPSVSPTRPTTNRRHTESGWFEKRLKKQPSFLLSRDGSISKSFSSRSISTKMTRSTSTEGGIGITQRSVSAGDSLYATGALGGTPPRVELAQTPPIVWELDGGRKIEG